VRKGNRRWLAGMLVIFFILTSCSPPNKKVNLEKTRPLPEVATNDQNSSSYKPANVFLEMAPAVLSRIIYSGAGPKGYRVEVRDLELAGHKKAEGLPLPGAVFAEVFSGSGVVTTDQGRQDLASGATLSISQGQRFSLESNSDQPLIVRLYLVASE